MLNDFLARVFPVSYRDYIKSSRWRKLAAMVRTLSGHRCQLCGVYARLQVHHRTYRRLGYELLSDLIALCANCHARVHERARRIRRSREQGYNRR